MKFPYFHVSFFFLVLKYTGALFTYLAEATRIPTTQTGDRAMLLVYRRISITRINKRIHHRWSCFLLILFFDLFDFVVVVFSFTVWTFGNWDRAHVETCTCVSISISSDTNDVDRGALKEQRTSAEPTAAVTEIKRTTMERFKWLHQFNDRTIWKRKIPPFICTSLRLYIYIFLVE